MGSFDGARPDEDAATGRDVPQVVKLKRSLGSSAHDSNASNVRRCEVPGSDCPGRSGSYVGEPTLVLENTEQLTSLAAEDQDDAIARCNTKRRILPEAGCDFHGEGLA